MGALTGMLLRNVGLKVYLQHQTFGEIPISKEDNSHYIILSLLIFKLIQEIYCNNYQPLVLKSFEKCRPKRCVRHTAAQMCKTYSGTDTQTDRGTAFQSPGKEQISQMSLTNQYTDH